ncbi:hypothetical protein BDN67DRAFT_968557 [Paxillus ammoniavirescens]|nr:hypothetical protein BDN67DRAFT_968557 [Paxillus ammoniavirescens]
MAWQEWYHPDMPWEGSLLCVADILVQSDTFLVTNNVHVAGKKLDVSIGYPTCVDDFTLLYTSCAPEGFQNTLPPPVELHSPSTNPSTRTSAVRQGL